MLKLCIVAIYILVMILIGYFGMRKTKNVGDFFLGGRTIGPWLSAFAYGATYFSAVLFIGYAGKLGWGFGLHTMWIVLGNALVGVCLAWYVLAGRTRSMTTRLDAMTMPEFLAARYDSPTFLVGAALIIFVFLVPYSASVYMGLSYLFEVNLGIPYEYALLFMGILTGIYLIMGGYFALTLTDLIQGLVMLFGVFVMVGVLVPDRWICANHSRPDASRIRSGSSGKNSHSRMGNTVEPGHHYKFRAVGITPDGAEILFHQERKHHSTCNARVHGCGVHYGLRRVLHRLAHTSIL